MSTVPHQSAQRQERSNSSPPRRAWALPPDTGPAPARLPPVRRCRPNPRRVRLAAPLHILKAKQYKSQRQQRRRRSEEVGFFPLAAVSPKGVWITCAKPVDVATPSQRFVGLPLPSGPMSFASGSLSFRRFAVEGAAPSVSDQDLLDRLSEHALRPSDVGHPPEVEYGFS